MCKYEKICSIAYYQAQFSPCKNKHGCVITKGSKVYAVGYNNPRSTFLNKKDCSQHAEMAAVTSLINKYIRRNPRKYKAKNNKYDLSSFTIWCIRIPNDKSRLDNYELYDSGPCSICVKRLNEFGFKDIIYSNNEGVMVKDNIKTYNKVHITSASYNRQLNKKKKTHIVI